MTRDRAKFYTLLAAAGVAITGGAWSLAWVVVRGWQALSEIALGFFGLWM